MMMMMHINYIELTTQQSIWDENEFIKQKCDINKNIKQIVEFRRTEEMLNLFFFLIFVNRASSEHTFNLNNY